MSLMGFYHKPSMEAGGGASDRVYTSESDPGGHKKVAHAGDISSPVSFGLGGLAIQEFKQQALVPVTPGCLINQNLR